MDDNNWECTTCGFKTTNDDEAIKHEHNTMNVSMSLSEEQIDRAFGVD